MLWQIRRDQVDLVISGREGKIFGSVGRKNNNKNISQIYCYLLQAIKNGLKQGLISRSAKICTRIFIAFIWYTMNILPITILYIEWMIGSKFVQSQTSENSFISKHLEYFYYSDMLKKRVGRAR